MVGPIFEEVRQVLLSLLFVLAFGWTAAQVIPGALGEGGGQQIAQWDSVSAPDAP